MQPGPQPRMAPFPCTLLLATRPQQRCRRERTYVKACHHPKHCICFAVSSLNTEIQQCKSDPSSDLFPVSHPYIRNPQCDHYSPKTYLKPALKITPACVQVVKLLVDVYPEAVSVKNEDGWLPLHSAVEGKAPTKVAQLLARPDACNPSPLMVPSTVPHRRLSMTYRPDFQ